jgi:glyoxylase-like metal-dependent hydrolase (beta-lactamase superfamily II)/ferredoxin
MADIGKKLAGNVDGDFFVDSTCQNMDICRQVAPENFTYWQDYAVVGKQPEGGKETRQALHAVLCCPYGSIGTTKKAELAEAMQDFPIQIDNEVYFCGFNSPKTSGGNSYFVKHQGGNWLFSTPKFQAQLVKKLENMGGVSYIFLSHRDDAGESEKFAQHFKAQRIIHKHDLEAQPHAEVVLNETESYEYQPDFFIIPSPGHTEGHMMMLYKNKYLFSGDSLYYDRKESRLEIWNPLWTWYSYEEQTMSMEKLLNKEFDWLLPSHGQRVHLEKSVMKQQLQDAIDRAWQLPDPEAATPERVRILEQYAGELKGINQPEYAKLIQAKADWLKTLIK